jgi:hypothetical protein
MQLAYDVMIGHHPAMLWSEYAWYLLGRPDNVSRPPASFILVLSARTHTTWKRCMTPQAVGMKSNCDFLAKCQSPNISCGAIRVSLTWKYAGKLRKTLYALWGA